jgi:hypothetical protein
MKQLFIGFLLFLSFCSVSHKENLLIEKVKLNSSLLKDSILSLDRALDYGKLVKVDSLVLSTLKRSNLFNADSCVDSTFEIYYYGYFESGGTNYFPVVFAKGIMTDAGDHELILTHIDKDGKLIDALCVAKYTSPAECTITEASTLKTNEINFIHKQTCYIIDNGENIGDRIDSSNSSFTINNNGYIIYKDGSDFKFERMVPE